MRLVASLSCQTGYLENRFNAGTNDSDIELLVELRFMFLRLTLGILGALLSVVIPAQASDFDANERVRTVMRQNGDDCTKLRLVEHYAYFPNEAMRQRYQAQVLAHQYHIQQAGYDAEYELPWSLIFAKLQKPGSFDLDTETLRTTASRYGGVYDGWSSPIVKD